MKYKNIINKGDIVPIKRKWLEPNEYGIVFIAAETYAGGNNVYVIDRDCTMNIVPVELIRLSMVEGYE